MKTVNIYKSHAWYWFYLSDIKLTADELYCETCNDSDWLIGMYEDKKLLLMKLKELWSEQWTLLVTEKNKDVTYKYVPQKYLKSQFRICYL